MRSSVLSVSVPGRFCQANMFRPLVYPNTVLEPSPRSPASCRGPLPPHICAQPGSEHYRSKSATSTRFASASKDGTCKVWDLSRVAGKMVFSLTQHTKCVTCVKWGGNDLIYTASQDTTIKVWRATDGALCRTLDVSIWRLGAFSACLTCVHVRPPQ